MKDKMTEAVDTPCSLPEASRLLIIPTNDVSYCKFRKMRQVVSEFDPPCQVEQAWRRHVHQLDHHRSAEVAVHTFFLFGRLYTAICQQLCSLTQEACNYVGNGHRSFAAHFTVTVEELLSQFELPRVFVDAELVSIMDSECLSVLLNFDHPSFTSSSPKVACWTVTSHWCWK